MFADVLLVAGKDLRVELRSRVALNQVVPFALLVLVSVFLGKAIALIAELLLLAIVLLGGVLILYGAPVDDVTLLLLTTVTAVIGVGAAGTLYGALLSGQRARETILPILLLPVLAPVVIGASRAFGDAMGSVATDGWSWLVSLVGFALLYLALGSVGHGALMEEV